MYVGRFAPSPTGPLHFGSLVAAVASYADARGANGRWLLRIEDVDTTRCTKAAEVEILRQLAAYGFESDGEITRQSQRTEQYAHAVAQLTHSGDVFVCTCSRKMLETAYRNEEGEAIYPGTCRGARHAVQRCSLRLRVPSSEQAVIRFVDRSFGVITQDVSSQVGDFILRRADGLYTYQLAVVIDDTQQGITDVVRGADLLVNTPRQIYLQRALGMITPTYLHVPVARNINGEKLSKQTLAQAISTDSAIETLHAAWDFLKQPDIARADSVDAFWRMAINAWTPTTLCDETLTRQRN